MELCRKVAFDIVIMDVMMPDMDGFAACEAIRRERDIPVLMLSARGAEYDRLLGFEAGVDDYVVKPFLPKELMARVRVIVSRHQSRAQRPELVLGGLRRVLYNLIDNALCHSENGRNVQVSLTGDGTRVRTEVRDRGEGIPEEELPYIWDRYFTAKQREAAGGGARPSRSLPMAGAGGWSTRRGSFRRQRSGFRSGWDRISSMTAVPGSISKERASPSTASCGAALSHRSDRTSWGPSASCPVWNAPMECSAWATRWRER